MRIKVRYLGEEKEVEIEKSKAKILDVLEILGIDPESVIVKKNGEITPEIDSIEDGDELEIIRVVTGG